MTFLKLTAAAASTAIFATSALAEAHIMDTSDLIRTRDITGGTIYSLIEPDAMWNDTTMYEAVSDGWNDIGEIEDIVLDRSGQMIGIIGEVGGFLDIGDKHVMIPVDNIRLTAVDDETYSYVTNMTEAELEMMQEVDEAFWD